MRKVKTTKDGHIFYEPNKKEEKEAVYVAKIFLIYESILKLEEKQGKIVDIKSLEKTVLKSKSPKLTAKAFRKLLDVLVLVGIVFYPEKGFVERFYVYD